VSSSILLDLWSSDWTKRGGVSYECNKYKVDSKGERENSYDGARKETNRYFKRYQIRQAHLKRARSLLETATKTYEEINSSIFLDPLLFTDTFQQLIEFRRVLMHTYIIGFYLLLIKLCSNVSRPF
jgi:hypothetical protein